MERVKRRWWTWAISLVATTVVAGAVLSGLFQLAVLAIPSYRDDLSTWVSDAAGRPVQIGGISLAWSGLSPRFDLSGITLFSEDGEEQLRVERLSLGLSVLRLVTGDILPNRLALAGLRISAEVDEQRRIRIAGFQPGDEAVRVGQRQERWLEDLERFESVEIEDSELRIVHPAFDDQIVSVRIDEAEYDHHADGFELDATLQLPPDRGGSVRLQAEIEGHVARLQSWGGRFEAEVDGLLPQGWLRPWLTPGTQIGVADLQALIDGDIEAGRVTRARMQFESGAMVLARAGVLSSAAQAQVVLDYRRDPRGWRLDVTDLSFDNRLLAHGSLRKSDLEGVTAYDLDADRIALGSLAPWVGVWRDAPVWVHTAGRLRGDVVDLIARLRLDNGASPRYSVRATLADLGLRADRNFGISGLSGALSADEQGGRFELTQSIPVLSAPQAIEQDVRFDALDGVLQWMRLANGWRLDAEPFSWAAVGTQGQGRLHLDLPDADGAGPVIDLQATLSANDVDAARTLMPTHWPDSLKTWLTEAIVDARVPSGQLSIKGPLHDFPFGSRPTGVWSLDLDVADVELKFRPEWPAIEDIDGRLHFEGNGLQVQVDSARYLGNAITGATARFENFNDHFLSVDAASSGQLEGYYALLRASPLKESLSALLDHTEARGPATVDLHLGIPLRQGEHTDVRGYVDLQQAQLSYAEVQPPVTEMTGRIHFNNDGVESNALQARFDDLPLQLYIEPASGTYGVIRGRFAFAPDPAGGGVAKYIPQFLREAVSGESLWELELPLRMQDSGLWLRSDLHGTIVSLPAPLGKAASQRAPLTLHVDQGTFSDVGVNILYTDRAAVSLEVGNDQDPAALTGLHARLGSNEVPPAAPDRYLLDGHVERFDVPAWLAAAPGSAEGGSGESSMALDTVEIDAGELVWGQQSAPATRVRYQPTSDGWRADFSGEGASGSLLWQSIDGGKLTARMDHLAMNLSLPKPASEAAAEVAVADPSQWPVIDAQCQMLRIGDADLGRLSLLTERVPGGQRFVEASLSEGNVELTLDGQWQRADGQSTGDLRFDLDTTEIESLLTAFGYEPSLVAGQTKFNGELDWAPSVDGLSWQMASGRIDVALDDGQLRAINAGASRVLGLISFYALPRRLTGNFDDVVGKGLAFDKIRGHFDLANGVASTDTLTMEGPSLRMDVNGTVGLAARDYDQRITVYPDVSSGVTLGAVLLGGPAVGALVLLAQELLDKPLDQVSQFSYRITGPWDNPHVERVDGDAASSKGMP